MKLIKPKLGEKLTHLFVRIIVIIIIIIIIMNSRDI